MADDFEKQKVLIVDDTPDNIQILMEALKVILLKILLHRNLWPLEQKNCILGQNVILKLNF